VTLSTPAVAIGTTQPFTRLELTDVSAARRTRRGGHIYEANARSSRSALRRQVGLNTERAPSYTVPDQGQLITVLYHGTVLRNRRALSKSRRARAKCLRGSLSPGPTLGSNGSDIQNWLGGLERWAGGDGAFRSRGLGGVICSFAVEVAMGRVLEGGGN
jgi:hypothetical protein